MVSRSHTRNQKPGGRFRPKTPASRRRAPAAGRAHGPHVGPLMQSLRFVCTLRRADAPRIKGHHSNFQSYMPRIAGESLFFSFTKARAPGRICAHSLTQTHTLSRLCTLSALWLSSVCTPLRSGWARLSPRCQPSHTRTQTEQTGTHEQDSREHDRVVHDVMVWSCSWCGYGASTGASTTSV